MGHLVKAFVETRRAGRRIRPNNNSMLSSTNRILLCGIFSELFAGNELKQVRTPNRRAETRPPTPSPRRRSSCLSCATPTAYIYTRKGNERRRREFDHNSSEKKKKKKEAKTGWKNETGSEQETKKPAGSSSSS
jgi:hypothetical protein